MFKRWRSIDMIPRAPRVERMLAMEVSNWLSLSSGQLVDLSNVTDEEIDESLALWDRVNPQLSGMLDAELVL